MTLYRLRDPAGPWVDTVEGRKGCNPRVLTHEQLIPQQATMSLVALPGGKLLGVQDYTATVSQQRPFRRSFWCMDFDYESGRQATDIS